MTSPRTSTSRPVLSAFLALAIAVFFSLFAVGGAQAGQGNGQGSEKSEEAKAKAAQENSSQEKTPDQTLNDHPSGKDRTEEPGGSGTQGKSTSDPDGLANGGADKPGGDGGFDDDQDGNNGCGNDDDFEDDNNGWCRGKPEVEGTDIDRDIEDEEETVTDTVVLGSVFTRAAPAVLGDTQAAPAALAATGFDLNTMLALGLGLVLLGTAAVTSARRPAPVPTK